MRMRRRRGNRPARGSSSPFSLVTRSVTPAIGVGVCRLSAARDLLPGPTASRTLAVISFYSRSCQLYVSRHFEEVVNPLRWDGTPQGSLLHADWARFDVASIDIYLNIQETRKAEYPLWPYSYYNIDLGILHHEWIHELADVGG